MSKARGWSGFAVLCIFAAIVFGAVTSEAAIDGAVDFGTDHPTDMSDHNTQLLPDAGSHAVAADYIGPNGDWASVEWDLATSGAGNYRLDVGMGIGASRQIEMLWVVDGVTNSSGTVVGSGDYEVVTNSYSVTVPGGVSTVHCIFDVVMGLTDLFDATLTLLPPPDNSVDFGSDHTADMDGNFVTLLPDAGSHAVYADYIAPNGIWASVEWDLGTSGAGNYRLDVGIGIDSTRFSEIRWVVDGVTNSSGTFAGSGAWANETNSYSVTVPGGVSMVHCIFQPVSGGMPDLLDATLTFLSPLDNSVDFGTDHTADMDGNFVTLLPDSGSHAVYADYITPNGDWASVEWYFGTAGAGNYTLDVTMGIGATRQIEMLWEVDGVTNSSGTVVGSGGWEMVTKSYSVTVPGGVSTVHCIFDVVMGFDRFV